MTSTICLNMIVKNESEIIIKTLENLTSKIKFDYWVISDTGSDDNTKELIIDYMKNKNIKGELIENKWKDFGHNRTLALEAAYNKTDYLLIFDADDEIVGNIVLPNKLTYDKYDLRFGQEFSYVRPLLINNRRKWVFRGVLHEFLDSFNQLPQTKTFLEGDYYVISGRTGNRSKDKDKYMKDAKILSNAFDIETNPFLKCRYAFYCAQSYKDCNQKEKSIEWYLKCLDLDNWDQEKYYSCLVLGILYMDLNDISNAQKYWYKTSKYDKERIEGIILLIQQLRTTENNIMINLLYHKFKNYKKSQDKLFLIANLYNDELEYENAVSAYYVDDLKSGYECCKKILINNIMPNNKLITTLNNLNFYINQSNDDTTEECLKLYNAIDKLLDYNTKHDNNSWKILFNRVKPLVDTQKIKIINLEHRTDRKENMVKLLTEHQIIDSCEFIKAVNGKKLISSLELVKLFEGNNFNYMRGVIGCALSNLYLWKKLLEDKENDYYIIMEDDITLCVDFKKKIKLLEKTLLERDLIFLGYHMWSDQRKQVSNIYDIESPEIYMSNLNKNLYIGGIFLYSINKNGAKKLIQYIEKNGIKIPIDNLMGIVQEVNQFEVKPFLAFSDWAEHDKIVDSDIQYDHNSLFSNTPLSTTINEITNTNTNNNPITNTNTDTNYLDKFVFVKNVDHFGDDLYKLDLPLDELFKIALNDVNCKGFNTLGYFKHTINNLFKPECFKENDGIYIKK